jgi:hypothetical protein
VHLTFFGILKLLCYFGTYTVFGPIFWTNFLDQFFGPIFWTNFLDQLFGPTFWTNFLDQLFGPTFWTNFLDQLFGPTFWTNFFLDQLLFGPTFWTNLFWMNFLTFNHCELYDRSTFDLVFLQKANLFKGFEGISTVRVPSKAALDYKPLLNTSQT